MRAIKTNKMAAVWLLMVGISLMSSQGLVGVSPDHPPGRTVPQLLLTAVRLEVAIPFIPKVGEIFEATITIYCKNDLEYYKAGPDYTVQFEGDVEIIEGREHIIHGYLKKGETRRFKAKMVIKESKEKVGIGGSIVATKPVPFGQGAYIEMFLLDPETGQYGTKEEYEGNLPAEYRYDPVDGSFTCSPSLNPAPVEENRRIIKMIRELEPRLSDSLALLLHSDQYRVGIPRGVSQWDSLNQRWIDKGVYEYYLRDGWFKALQEGKRDEWLKKEKAKIEQSWKEGSLNFFRPDNHNNSGGNNRSRDRTQKDFYGQWWFKDHKYNKTQGLLADADKKPIKKGKARLLMTYWNGGFNRVLSNYDATDDSGYFHITFDIPAGAYNCRAYAVIYPSGPDPSSPKLNVSDSNWTIADYWKDSDDPTLYAVRENGVPPPHDYDNTSDPCTLGVIWTDTFPAYSQPHSGSINIYEIYLHARTFMSPPPTRPLRVMWEPGYTHGTAMNMTYPANDDTIWVTADANTPPDKSTDEWDDDILLDEFGHYIMKCYAQGPPSDTGAHAWPISYPEKPGLAYGEGWSEFFSCRARVGSGTDSLIINTAKGIGGDSVYVWSNIENPWLGEFDTTTFMGGPWCEGAVAGVLWDIYDAKDEIPYHSYPWPGFPDTALADSLTMGFDEIWTVFDHYDPLRPPKDPQDTLKNCWTIFHFRSGWNDYDYDHEFALNQILLHHRIKDDIPVQPVGLSASQENNYVRLEWSPNSEPDLDGYRIYRREQATRLQWSDWTLLVDVSDTTHLDTTVDVGNTYGYKVSAFDTLGNVSEPSDSIEINVQDIVPPLAPYLVKVEKSATVRYAVDFIWDKITTDTLGNLESMHYYIVYRDTQPDFIPSTSDSIGAVAHPDTTYTDQDVLTDSDSYYYLIMAVDSASNKSKKSNMGYKFNKFVNENPDTPTTTSDRNWVSLPYISEYDSVKDITDDVSSSGDPINKITRLDAMTQNYYSWIYHSLLGWYGNDPTHPNFPIVLGTAYEMIAVADDTVIFAGANEPDSLISLNENPDTDTTTSDRNWISMPYNAAYDSVEDITDELSPAGSTVTKITMLDEPTQLYYSWIWHFVLGWYGNHPTTPNFPITPGTGYEFVATKDTTWNPIEWTNEAKGLFVVTGPRKKHLVEIYVGSLQLPDRAPVWVIDEGGNKEIRKELENNIYYRYADLYRPMTVTSKCVVDRMKNSIGGSATRTYNSEGTGEPRGNTEDERRISHIVWTHFDEAGFENIVFTTYRLNNPRDVLTEKSASCVTANNGSSYNLISFDVGNFKKPWKNGEETVLIVEATMKGKAYYDIIDYQLNEGVDIQELRAIELKPYSTLLSGENKVYWNTTHSDMLVGYSLYQIGKRLNEKVLTKNGYTVEADVDLRLVIVGGHETVYGSQGIQSSPKEDVPISYTFSIKPNPFVKETRLAYALPNQAAVKIVIYDVAGRKVKTLVSEIKNPGYYSATWNGTGDMTRKLSSGVYFIRFEAGEFQAQDKILLVK